MYSLVSVRRRASDALLSVWVAVTMHGFTRAGALGREYDLRHSSTQSTGPMSSGLCQGKYQLVLKLSLVKINVCFLYLEKTLISSGAKAMSPSQDSTLNPLVLIAS